MRHADAVLHQPFDHETRRGRPADDRLLQIGQLAARRVDMLEHGEPYRGHARRMGDLFAIHQIAQHRRIVHRGIDELHPRHRARPRQAPACRMEHRHHRQHHAGRIEIESHRLDAGPGMQHGGTVFVQHALRVPRRAAGITQHAGIAFVDARPFRIAILGADPVLERDGIGPCGRIETDVMVHRRPAVLHQVDDGLEGGIIQHHAIFGVVDDVIELILEQAGVHGVQDAAGPGGAVPGDEMARMVHRQRGDPVALADAELGQRQLHLQRIAANPRPVGARFAAVGPVSHMLARSVFARRMVDQAAYDQIPILHGSQQLVSP